jgi:hypothetical protein
MTRAHKIPRAYRSRKWRQGSAAASRHVPGKSPFIKLVDRVIVARVRPRTSKGITDLLLPPASSRCRRRRSPSKKYLRASRNTPAGDMHASQEFGMTDTGAADISADHPTAPIPLQKRTVPKPEREARDILSRRRSRSLTELTRQVTPPTKNGHAPPPIQSRKSSQSVNPWHVLTW